MSGTEQERAGVWELFDLRAQFAVLLESTGISDSRFLLQVSPIQGHSVACSLAQNLAVGVLTVQSLLSRPLYQDAGGNDGSSCGFVVVPGLEAQTDGLPADSGSPSSLAQTRLFSFRLIGAQGRHVVFRESCVQARRYHVFSGLLVSCGSTQDDKSISCKALRLLSHS